jgi:hypothetical protein
MSVYLGSIAPQPRNSSKIRNLHTDLTVRASGCVYFNESPYSYEMQGCDQGLHLSSDLSC